MIKKFKVYISGASKSASIDVDSYKVSIEDESKYLINLAVKKLFGKNCVWVNSGYRVGRVWYNFNGKSFVIMDSVHTDLGIRTVTIDFINEDEFYKSLNKVS